MACSKFVCSFTSLPSPPSSPLLPCPFFHPLLIPSVFSVFHLLSFARSPSLLSRIFLFTSPKIPQPSSTLFSSSTVGKSPTDESFSRGHSPSFPYFRTPTSSVQDKDGAKFKCLTLDLGGSLTLTPLIVPAFRVFSSCCHSFCSDHRL